jgi:hypothetical protein
VNTLTGQTLELNLSAELMHIPSLAYLPALRTLQLMECSRRQECPPLDTLTALKTFTLSKCMLLESPCVLTLTALRSLELREGSALVALPPHTDSTVDTQRRWVSGNSAVPFPGYSKKIAEIRSERMFSAS